jgi:hypothetical protein
VVEHLGSGSGKSISTANVGYAEVKTELKKMNKHLRHISKLKKQGNLMDGIFYLCAIFPGFVYLPIISR